MTPVQTSDAVRDRILDQAEILFAEKGFQGVSVREITRAARCNLAAVNYYFGGKEKLYIEVFRRRWIPRAQRVRSYFEHSLNRERNPTPSSIVRKLAEAFLEGPLSDDERVRHYQLISRELTRPSEAFELIVEQVMRPFLVNLAARLRDGMNRSVEPLGLALGLLSVFSQVMYFNFARTVVSRVTGRDYDPEFRMELLEHITQFAIKGLNLYPEESALCG